MIKVQIKQKDIYIINDDNASHHYCAAIPILIPITILLSVSILIPIPIPLFIPLFIPIPIRSQGEDVTALDPT